MSRRPWQPLAWEEEWQKTSSLLVRRARQSDRGAALLIDDRYMHNEYRDLFARIWTHYDVVTSPEDIETNLASFYSEKD